MSTTDHSRPPAVPDEAGDRTAHRRARSDARARETEALRAWLRERAAAIGMSINRIETEAGIPGNAIGKFLRGERGRVHGLTPLHLRRLAPILAVGESELLALAGHLSEAGPPASFEGAVRADPRLSTSDKELLITVYGRLVEQHESLDEEPVGWSGSSGDPLRS